jgi:hypothetical protein
MPVLVQPASALSGIPDPRTPPEDLRSKYAPAPDPAKRPREVLVRGPEVDQRRAEPKQWGTHPRSVPSNFEAFGYPSWVSKLDTFVEGIEGDDDEDYEFVERGGTAASRDDELTESVYATYLAVLDGNVILENDGVHTGSTGVTVMLRDVPYRMQVEPDLFDLLREAGNLDHVDYIYLPMTIGEVTTRSNATPKNKGYCFIHFSNSATADLFAARVQQYGDKTMYATQAKFQGVVMNLVNLLDIQSKKWRPRHGVAHVRLLTGELACVQLRPLRNLFKQRSSRFPRQDKASLGPPSAVSRAAFQAPAAFPERGATGSYRPRPLRSW